jgi:hypothetical protein
LWLFEQTSVEKHPNIFLAIQVARFYFAVIDNPKTSSYDNSRKQPIDARAVVDTGEEVPYQVPKPLPKPRCDVQIRIENGVVNTSHDF